MSSKKGKIGHISVLSTNYPMMQNTTLFYQIITIVSLWSGYFAIHSLMASLTVKRWVAEHSGHLMPAYRISFNIVSALLIIPIVWLSFIWSADPLWRWSPAVYWLLQAVSLVVLVAFYFSLRYYDMSEFFGTRQWLERNKKVEDQEQFTIGEFHRFVRHPWYSMGIVLIWCRELDPVMLASAVMISLYFMFGSRLEERKLIQYHGDVYRRYMASVPGLLPRPWRFLNRDQARQLLAEK